LYVTFCFRQTRGVPLRLPQHNKNETAVTAHRHADSGLRRVLFLLVFLLVFLLFVRSAHGRIRWEDWQLVANWRAQRERR
jgi:hypothetical protein